MPPRTPSRGSSSGNSSSAASTEPPPTRRLSRADSLVNTKRSSVTSPIPPRRMRWYMGVKVGVLPNITIPSTGVSSPAMVSSVVVFPAPFGPSRQTTSPWWTFRFTPWTTARLRYPHLRLRVCSSGLMRHLPQLASYAARVRCRARRPRFPNMRPRRQGQDELPQGSRLRSCCRSQAPPPRRTPR